MKNLSHIRSFLPEKIYLMIGSDRFILFIQKTKSKKK